MLEEEHVSYQGVERRKQRSPLPSQAIHFQLQQVSERYQLELIMLFSADGGLWASSSNLPDLYEQIQSMTHSLRECHGEDDFKVFLNGAAVWVKAFKIGGTKLFLAAQGDIKRCIPALVHAVSGIERILGFLGQTESA